MKIKKYTIDEEIPKGAVFMDSKEVPVGEPFVIVEGKPFYKESRTEYEFLVEEESEEKFELPEYNTHQLNLIIQGLESLTVQDELYEIVRTNLLEKFKNLKQLI